MTCNNSTMGFHVHTKKNMPGCSGWIKQLRFCYSLVSCSWGTFRYFLLPIGGLISKHCMTFIQGFELLFGCLLWFELSNCSNFWTLCFFGYLISKSWFIYLFIYSWNFVRFLCWVLACSQKCDRYLNIFYFHILLVAKPG